jgi:hypothetical protein
MIRLSTAHAKMRMSKTIDVVDSSVAIEIMRFVVEAEGLAPSSAANKAETSTEELSLVEGERQGERVWASPQSLVALLHFCATQLFYLSDDGGVCDLLAGISKRKYSMFQKHFKE